MSKNYLFKQWLVAMANFLLATIFKYRGEREKEREREKLGQRRFYKIDIQLQNSTTFGLFLLGDTKVFIVSVQYQTIRS